VNLPNLEKWRSIQESYEFVWIQLWSSIAFNVWCH